MNLKEKKSINNYQNLKQKLPKYKYLHQYIVLDFYHIKINEINKTKDLMSEIFDKLSIYIKDLNKYNKALLLASNARNNHYKEFIKNIKEEDENHRIWRKGLNNIVLHNERTLEYWSNILDNNFDILIKNDTETKYLVSLSLDIEDNIEYNIEENIINKNIVHPPSLTKSQKRKRKNNIIKLRNRRKLKLINDKNIYENNVFKTFDNVDNLLSNTNLIKKLYLSYKYNISNNKLNLENSMLLSTSTSFIEGTEEEYMSYISYNIEKVLIEDNPKNALNLAVLSIDTKGKQYLLKNINNLNLNTNIKRISAMMCMLTYEDIKKYSNISVRKFYIKNYRYIYLQYINSIEFVLKEKDFFRKILLSIP